MSALSRLLEVGAVLIDTAFLRGWVGQATPLAPPMFSRVTGRSSPREGKRGEN